MLEKLTGNKNTQKLRAMLLFEAHFSDMHEIIFNDRLIPSIEAANAILMKAIEGRRS